MDPYMTGSIDANKKNGFFPGQFNSFKEKAVYTKGYLTQFLPDLPSRDTGRSIPRSILVKFLNRKDSEISKLDGIRD